MENSDSSDSSDEDYIPNEREVVSEEDESGEDEEFLPCEDAYGDDSIKPPTKSGDRRNSLRTHKGSRQRRGRKTASVSKGETEEEEEALTEIKALDEKQKTDSLWADFMKDVGSSRKKDILSDTNKKQEADDMLPASASSSSSSSSSAVAAAAAASKQSSLLSPALSPSPADTTKSGKVTVVREYDFAGETVVVTKELDVNSREAKQVLSSSSSAGGRSTASQPPVVTCSSVSPFGGAATSAALKRPAGGLNTVLGKLEKKQKMSTLEKSKLDWDGFKQKEGINEELQIHNRGKEGYLERVAFLQRTDQRQYEIERNLRLGSSHKHC